MLMKAGAKRRRTKEEIKLEKLEAQRREEEIAEKLNMFE